MEEKKENNLSEPNIKVFGQQISGEKIEKKAEEGEERRGKAIYIHKHYHGDDSNPSAGLIILIAGVIFMFNVFGQIPWEFWNHVWKFWPAILILIGIAIFFGNNWVSKFIVFVFTLIFLMFVAAYGLSETGTFLQYMPQELINIINNFKQI
jgi:cation transport ATPase